MQLIIETLSYTLIGSGESSGIINNDIVFDNYGIPYIPARRVKGLLRESSREVCEILKLDKEIIDEIFGTPGFKEGKIKIKNLFIENYKDIIDEIQFFQKQNDYKHILTKNKIISYFTVVRQQTAIDKKGISIENSLRTIRILKPGIKFVVDFNSKNLDNYDKAFLFLSCMNLRRIGGKINRGLGKINCFLECGLNLEKAFKILLGKKRINSKQSYQHFEKKEDIFILKDRKKKLSFIIKALSPLIIGVQKGNQNTISTKRYIPALSIRGLLANEYLKKYGLKTDTAQNDPIFYNLFLSNNVFYGNAYPFLEDKIFYPSPLCIQEKEGYETGELYNILIEFIELNTKPIDSFIFINNNQILLFNPETTIFFHHIRDRLTGSSIKNGIFYYEALKEGLEFKGFIYGDENLLKKFKDIFNQKFQGKIGKSRSAQYGDIEFIFGEIEEIEQKDFMNNDEILITAISPIILYNKQGFSVISEDILKEYIEKFLNIKIKEIKSIVKLEQIENYVNIWNSKSPREFALGIGSSFLIKFDSLIDSNMEKLLLRMELEGIGEKLELGYGKIILNWISEEKYKKKIIRFKELESSASKKLKPESLKEILNYVIKSEFKEYFENKGFKSAHDNKERYIKKLTNSLIYKLDALITESNNFDDLKIKMKIIKNKNVKDRLIEVGLFDLFNNITKDKFKESFEKESDFLRYKKILEDIDFNIDEESILYEFFKNYWKTFFKYLIHFKKLES
ncbi:MAG: RAMP superfamily CRISPR-associated protein [Promethearchaeota archaeon]